MRSMTKPLAVAFLAMSILTPLAWADSDAPEQTAESIWQGREKMGIIMPIFGQLVRTSQPKGFQIAPAYEKVVSGRYTRETVLDGENVDAWTQMITISGAKDLAINPDATPRKVSNNIAGGYKNACPGSFSAAVFPPEKIDGREAFVAIISCGTSPLTQGSTSESALVVVIKGEQDYYTFKWSERTAPSSTPMAIDVAKWSDRFKLIMPIHLCPIVPGEPAPYPSCIDKK
jgi:hypothetical protein